MVDSSAQTAEMGAGEDQRLLDPVNSSSFKPAPESHDSLPGTKTQDEIDMSSEAKLMVDLEAKKDRGCSASLYCPKTGYPHSLIQELSLKTCPSCKQRLSKITIEEENETSPDTEDAEKDIFYEIEYIDKHGNFMGKEKWPSLLNLEEARKGIALEGRQGVMKVISSVQTTHELNPRDSPKDSLADLAILTNPRIGLVSNGTRIAIYSRKFISALKMVVSYYPHLNVEGKTLDLVEPYAEIAHHAKELRGLQAYSEPPQALQMHGPGSGLASGRCDQETSDHIDIVLNFLEEFIWKGMIREEEQRLARDDPSATFAMLWWLYKPGTTVYIESDGRFAAYVILDVAGDSSVLFQAATRLEKYTVRVWYLDFDGRHVRRCERKVVITPFEGERRVMSLGVIPASVLDKHDQGVTKARLQKEGYRWYEYLQVDRVRYQGATLDIPAQQIDDRVVIDCSSYWEHKNTEGQKSADPVLPVLMGIVRANPFHKPSKDEESRIQSAQSDGKPKLAMDYGDMKERCPCTTCIGLRPHPPASFKWTDYDLIDPATVATLDLSESHGVDIKHRYLLCSKRLMGVSLKSRNWHVLDVANCHSISPNREAIETLVMPDERKTMIKALVHRFSTAEDRGAQFDRPWSADFIESKGEGRIFLLHGGPGVGKTYTAECIAEFTGRPLLSLTCGDLGNDETKLEQNLSKWFKLAERWGAVMLLDEADVCMVSVFLRCMEYYRGILFLTTNRVGTFDEAFVSRIHVVIHYDDLSASDRHKIWKRFFQKLEDEREDAIKVHSNAREYVFESEKMQSFDWNGREIRNAFQTAVALCEYQFSMKKSKKEGEIPVLKREHFEEVCGIVFQFKEYLKATHGNKDSTQQAARQKLRAGKDDLGRLLE
ncbi:P-loop containing nucleoside triphosphate hydrolase protein [Xylariaceae sp. FL0016]|nr:P-loop containing nucleoside triphosphate hydrolase protein [Xylariaceae sp. FL0016]